MTHKGGRERESELIPINRLDPEREEKEKERTDRLLNTKPTAWIASALNRIFKKQPEVGSNADGAYHFTLEENGGMNWAGRFPTEIWRERKKKGGGGRRLAAQCISHARERPRRGKRGKPGSERDKPYCELWCIYVLISFLLFYFYLRFVCFFFFFNPLVCYLQCQ